MASIPIKYQLSYFTNNADFTLKSEGVADLLKMFAEYEFLPSTFQEIGVGVSMATTRLRLSRPNGDLSFDIGAQRLDVEKQATDEGGSNMGTALSFCDGAIGILSTFLKSYPRRSLRLAYVIKVFLPESPSDFRERTFNSLFRPLPYYEKNPPFEWLNRTAADGTWKNGNEIEPLNVITTATRARGSIGPLAHQRAFDRVIVDYDVNTKPENADTRFSIDAVQPFCVHAESIVSELERAFENILK